MVDIDEIRTRLDRVEEAQLQQLELMNMRFERLEMHCEHIEKKIDLLSECF